MVFTQSIQPFSRRSAAFLLLAGPLVLALCALDVYPSIHLAARLSDDGVLSAVLLRLLKLSQLWTGIGLTLGTTAAWLLRSRAQIAARLLARPSPRMFVALVAATSGAGALFVQQALFDGIPHVTDATSHWFQAQIFRTGRLAVPAPPCPDAFFQHGVVLNERGLWHSKYYPGTALGLACLGRGFLPLSFAVLLAAFYFAVRRYVSDNEARLATLLMGFSPMLLLLAGSYMSHVPLLMWLALAWVGALRGLEGNKPAAIGAGLAAGMGMLTRPLDAVLLGSLTSLLLLLDGRYPLRRKWICLGWTVCGLAIPVVFLMIQNVGLYDTPFTTGYNFSHSAAHYQIRFGLSDRFTFAQACKQGGWIVGRLNQALFGWPSSLVFIAYLFWAAPRRRSSYWLALAIAGLYAPYFFYFYYGFEYEARYTFATVPLLCILTAQGIRACARHPRYGWCAPGLLAAFALYAATYYWPAYLWPRYANAYEEVSPEIHSVANAARLETPALVLLPDAGFVYSSGFIYNDPLLRAPILYARDIPALDSCLQAAFPDRRIYRYLHETDGRRPAFAPIAPIASSPLALPSRQGAP